MQRPAYKNYIWVLSGLSESLPDTDTATVELQTKNYYNDSLILINSSCTEHSFLSARLPVLDYVLFERKPIEVSAPPS